MNILFISHTPGGGPFVVGSHHLAKAMANMGHKVLHISPPVTPAHLLRISDQFERHRLGRWLRKGDLRDGVLDIVPGALLPWDICSKISGTPHLMFAKFTGASVGRLLKAANMQSPDIVFIDEPRLAGLIPLLGPSRIVYRPTDVYSRIRNDMSIDDAERFLISVTHRFIATSEPVATHIRALGAKAVLVMENGVDLAHFTSEASTKRTTDQSKGKPIAIYAGALDQRFGFDSLVKAATDNPDLHFLLLGPVTQIARTRVGNIDNVELHGPIAFSELPAYLKSASIALLPLSEDTSNQGRSPMKLFEYAATGLPIVATRTEELSRRKMDYVALADSPMHFSELLKEWKNGRMKLEDGRTAAAEHGWVAKANQAIQHATN